MTKSEQLWHTCPMTQSEFLRRQARELRYAAAHAERAGDARADQALAAELEERADQLDGIQRFDRERPQRSHSPESRGALLQRGFAALEAVFGPSARPRRP